MKTQEIEFVNFSKSIKVGHKEIIAAHTKEYVITLYDHAYMHIVDRTFGGRAVTVPMANVTFFNEKPSEQQSDEGSAGVKAQKANSTRNK